MPVSYQFVIFTLHSILNIQGTSLLCICTIGAYPVHLDLDLMYVSQL